MSVEETAFSKPGMASPEGRRAGALTASFSLSGAAATASTRTARGMKHLCQKAAGPGRVSRASDVAQADAEILIAGHQNPTVQENPAGKQHTIQNPAHDRPSL
ncbi:hypothetical protein, partial [Gluconacetobacter sacchari]|uniref:hypothetical protein n=1 Tax=Gluconacetobacter sacchari TaxID=92759 RepID=UPI00222EBB6F